MILLPCNSELLETQSQTRSVLFVYKKSKSAWAGVGHLLSLSLDLFAVDILLHINIAAIRPDALLFVHDYGS